MLVVSEYSEQLTNLRGRIEAMCRFLHIEDKRAHLVELQQQSSADDFWNDQQHAQAIMAKMGALRAEIKDYEQTCSMLEDAEIAQELALEDAEMNTELARCIEELENKADSLELASWFDGKFDSGDCIVSINPGAGGLEAQDWAEMLYRMLSRYCENKGWKVVANDIVAGEVIGLDHAVFTVSGHNSYGMLRSEIGVHRLVRISPTDEKKRRHTTFAAVDVVPVLPDDIEVDIKQEDIRIDVYRASGPGGQCVNTTDSAVRITHKPSGIVVTCQNEKSQLQNKEAAMKILKSRLFEMEERKREEELAKIRGDKKNIEWGSQIRNYVLYPYQLVKDVRSGVESGNVDAVLDGDLDEFVVGYHRWRKLND